MKNIVTRVVLAVATLLVITSMSFAIDVKKSDSNKGSAKETVDKNKTNTSADVGKSKSDAKGAADKTKTDAKSKIVDINSATEAELKAIPGIGDTYSAKIIAGRPYANKAQLKSRKILPAPVYEKTKDLIVATKPKK
jgi:DNA uptake protein ComE-like DNA-binding protein